MKILLISLLLLVSYTLSFASSSALSALRQSERSNTLKDFKIQMKSRLSSTSGRKASRHRSSSVIHNNRFVHQSSEKMKQLNVSSSTIQNSAVNVKNHYDKTYEELKMKYQGNEQEIHDKLLNYKPYEDPHDEIMEDQNGDNHDDTETLLPEGLDDDTMVGMPSHSVLWRRR